jgi:hypothetical protein
VTRHLTAAPPSLRLDAARAPPQRRRPAGSAGSALSARSLALALALALGLVPAWSAAQEAAVSPPPAGETTAGAEPASPPAAPAPPHLHRDWYGGLEFGLADATAGGAGKYYSLSQLNGGARVRPLAFGLRVGRSVGHDLRLGLALVQVVAQAEQGSISSSASVGRFGAELSWLPRGDGPFLRGELGLGWLGLSGDERHVVPGRGVGRLGPALTTGGGYRLAIPRIINSHLVASADLSYARYTESGRLGGKLTWSLAWIGRIGFEL